MEKQYLVNTDLDRHQCVSWLENNNIIFRCTQCDFVRQVNLETGDLAILQAGDPQALHSGSHQAVGSGNSMFDQN